MNENERTLCAICGEEHDIDSMTETEDGYVCEDCLSEEYFLCDHCEEYHRRDEAAEVMCRHGYRTVPEYWCESCVDEDAVRCYDCDTLCEASEAAEVDGYDICPDCVEDHYCTCDRCGELHHADTSHYDELEDWDTLCESCFQYLSTQSSSCIHEYGYKPDPIFAARQRERDIALLRKYGIELEVDYGEDRGGTAKAVTEAAQGRIYCKRDGSLSEAGFEIVTHPATLAYHLYDFRWANIMRICKKAGYKSHDTTTCGLHIHVGREGLGDTPDARYATASKLVFLTQAISAELVKFSRRKADRLEQWARMPEVYTTPSMSEDELLRVARDRVLESRYSAINLRNLSTVEFRFFRGTLKRDTLAASLQLVDNMCQYAMTHTARECMAASFVDIVNVNPTAVLVDYCQSRQLVHRTAA